MDFQNIFFFEKFIFYQRLFVKLHQVSLDYGFHQLPYAYLLLSYILDPLIAPINTVVVKQYEMHFFSRNDAKTKSCLFIMPAFYDK